LPELPPSLQSGASILNANEQGTPLILQAVSLQELVVEVIEGGRAGFIPALVDLEPIQMQLLLEEASRRLSQKFDSEDDFLKTVLKSEAQWLDAETKAVLRHAVKIKKIENRNKQ
jgi:hypothetical protein